jgi:hypothetical protein
MKPIILSPYMGNISPAIVEAQRKVVYKLGCDIEFKQVLTNKPHGATCDWMLSHALNVGYDVALLMDIDAIPLSLQAIEMTLLHASKGKLVGNIQRSNHIENNQHVFVAPSFMGINLHEWNAIGRPSFAETERGDVAEEVTYAYEAHGKPIIYYMPLRYDFPPIEAPFWKLRDGMPVYGCGTTFGIGTIEMSYHMFQIRTHKHIESFLDRCEAVYK